MDINVFLGYLMVWSTLTSLIVEGIKVGFNVKAKNILAFVVALIVGVAGNLIVCFYSNVAIDSKIIVTAILMGLATGLVSQVGYDKVKQAIHQIGGV